MGEFAQRLAEAARVAKQKQTGEIRIILTVYEEGIGISVWDHKWGGRSAKKIITYTEIEQCRFNSLALAIDQMVCAVESAAEAGK